MTFSYLSNIYPAPTLMGKYFSKIPGYRLHKAVSYKLTKGGRKSCEKKKKKKKKKEQHRKQQNSTLCRYQKADSVKH